MYRKDLFGGRYNLNLVVNAAEDGSTAQSTPQFDWPQSMDLFLDSLSRLNFNDYGYLGNSGVIEGISKALMMFPSTRKRTKRELVGKRHCVLVTASHPYPCPKEVLVPTNQILESGEVVEVTIDTVLADTETMARSLAESFISLSVICPNDMPMIKTIYDAGNQNPGSFTSNLKHPQLLLLISEQFPEAREALKQFEAENNDTNSQQDVFNLIAESLSASEALITQYFSTAEDHKLLQNIFANPVIEQPDETMPISTDEEINGFLSDPCLEENMREQMWVSDFEVASWPLGPNSQQRDAIVCNYNSTMQQGSQSQYLRDEQTVAGESIMITPQEKAST
ncbi:Mediator complex, subunit Med25, von Willebrand factor type A [Cynara cardunculus var. scolymus]|uniref:Mediator of RNA polymerase II transcription subunit 25 n=1 Tax=Cynara cardunculus var. scolymus TaxID=59895 RepID=A0A103XWZ3_CYNCS|nr:Mediator complex, subunit Med25, von Willebrand factor type A [Cynara cardunculus var. scolymus]